jgi:hypothetical protein
VRTHFLPPAPVLTVYPHSRGRAVTALGVLYDFTGNDKNTTVQKVEDMVKEAWVRDFHPFPEIISCLFLQFADAIKDEPDVFLLAGHMPVARDNCEFIYSLFPIIFFLLTLTQQGRLSSMPFARYTL